MYIFWVKWCGKRLCVRMYVYGYTVCGAPWWAWVFCHPQILHIEENPRTNPPMVLHKYLSFLSAILADETGETSDHIRNVLGTLSSRHRAIVAEHCYMLFYRLGNNNKTDQGDKTEGGRYRREEFERIILCLSLTKETFRFTVPPVLALLNYMRGGTFSWIFSPNWDFSLYIITFAGAEGSAKLRLAGQRAHSDPFCMLNSLKRRMWRKARPAKTS